MKEFWFVFLGGGAVFSPVAFFIGRWSLYGLLDRMARFLDNPIPEKPHTAPRSHVHVIRPAGDR